MKTIMGRHCSYLAKLLIAFIFVMTMRAAHAELPPGAYVEMQAKAPEVLTITVERVYTRIAKESWGQRTHVTAVVRVREVQRSKSKLKPGRIIYINYAHDQHTEPFVGPSQVPILRKGQKCPAYLKLTRKIRTKRGAPQLIFAPAAGGYSFDKVEVADKS